MSTRSDSATRRRISDRHPVRLPAELRNASQRSKTTLTDISAHGCCVVGYEGWIAINAPVHIRPEGMEALTAWVRWRRGNQIGVEFARPLYGPVLEYLVSVHGIGADLMAA